MANDKDNLGEHEIPFNEYVENAANKLNIEVDYLRQISPEEIKYLLDRCPFLQIVDPHINEKVDTSFQLLTASTNWDIHSYGDALSSSPAKFMFGGGDYAWHDIDIEQGSGFGDIVNPGKGTLIKQAFDTAREMVDLAAQRQWSAVKIIDGHPLMMRSAWIRAGQLGLALSGFVPDVYDEDVRNRLGLSEMEFELLRRQVKKGLGR